MVGASDDSGGIVPIKSPPANDKFTSDDMFHMHEGTWFNDLLESKLNFNLDAKLLVSHDDDSPTTDSAVRLELQQIVSGNGFCKQFRSA
jgi:hypothetical protein